MALAIQPAATGFTQTFTSFADLGAALGLNPDDPAERDTIPEHEDIDTALLAEEAATSQVPEPADMLSDPLTRMAGVRATLAALAARRERDRDERASAERERQAYDALLAEIERLGCELAAALAVRAELEDALARPFGDPEWIYDVGLREDYARAAVSAADAERAIAALIEERRREAERLAAQPRLARLLAEQRRHEETLRAQEDAAEAHRRRSAALASARSERDAGRFQEARRALGAMVNEFPDDSEVRSLGLSIDLAEGRVKDAEARRNVAEARRLRRADPAAAKALIEAIDTALLSADRMHEVAGVAAVIARHRDLIAPRFVRGRAPNSFAIIVEREGAWVADIAVGRDPGLRPGATVPPALVARARPLHARH